jgi:crotonobetainyl-CoA:carnitine CoA-transferase CaiB-like acyl-CoA transferase
VVLSVRSDDEWSRLTTLLDRPEALSHPQLATVVGRERAHDEIDAVISEWTRTRLPMDAARELQEAGIPAGPVLDESGALSDAQLHERGFFHLLAHPSCGFHLHPGTNFAMSRTPLEIWRAAPTLGQDNEYVYKDVIGVTDSEYEELIVERHVGDEYI